MDVQASNCFYSSKYKSLQNLIKFKVETDKQNFYDKKFDKSLHNPRHTWGLINNLIYNRNSKSNSVPKEIIYKNVIYDNPVSICNAFNDYFNKIGSELASNSINNQPAVNMNMNVNALNSFGTVTTGEVYKIIENLNSNSATGDDGISSKILKMSVDIFAPILARLINNCYQTGRFPDELKKAKIIPIFKGGVKSDPGNFRPISVTSGVSKIFEMTLKTRLEDQLVSCINVNQFGFQKKSSTSSACLNFTENVLQNIESGFKTSSTFIDIRKAFDSVDHSLLIIKLQNSGLSGIALQLIKSYLQNRRQYVLIDGFKSTESTIKTGVPQGSILGPTLFNLFINDLFDLNLHGRLQLYADDATLVYGEQNYRDLKYKMCEDLVMIQDWMLNNKLAINFNKTNFLIFYLRNTDTSEMFNDICFGDVKITRVLESKYLGLIINHNLNWLPHIQMVKNKVSKFIGVLYRISNYVSSATKLKIYYAYVHSQLTYLNTIWGSACDKNIKLIQVLQNKCMKIVYKLPRLTPSSTLYNNSILPIRYLYRYETSFLIFKINNQIIKFNRQFTLNNQIHSYQTRIVNNLRSIFSKNNVTKCSLFNQGVLIYNKIPNSLKTTKNVAIFKNFLKIFYYSEFLKNPEI